MLRFSSLSRSKRAAPRPTRSRSEPRDRLIAVDDLIVSVTPAEAQQPVHQRIGKNAEFAIGIDAQRAVPFRKLGPVGSVDQGNMRIDRRPPAESAEQLGLAETRC